MAVSRVISIEITDAVTRVCEMGYAKKNPLIYKSFIFENPDYSIDDGYIADRASYATELRNQLTTAGIKCTDVVFSLASNKVVSREIVIPDMKEDLILGLIENERSDYFPMDTSGHLFSYIILEKMKETKQLKLLVYAVPELLIKNYIAFAAEQDLKVIAIDYNGNSIYQWLKKSNHENMDLYLQINEKNSMFTILDKGTLGLQRNMNFGVNVLTANLIEEGYYGRGIDKAEALIKLRKEKLLYGSFVESQDFDPQDEDEAKLHECKRRLTDAVRPLIGNVARVLEYYNTKNRDVKVGKIYVGGIGSTVNGIKELIESEFNGIEIVIVNQLPGINIHKKNPLGNERTTEFIACYGAAEPSINFYRKNVHEQLRKTLILCFIGFVMVAVASAVIVINGKMEYDDAVKRKEAANTRLAAVEAKGIEQLEQQYTDSASDVLEVVTFHAANFSYNEKWGEILGYLESEAVSNMIVSSLSSSQLGLTLNISVQSKEEAAKLLLQFKKIPYFANVTINGLTENVEEETGIKTVDFSLLCEYKLPETKDSSTTEEGGNN